MLLPGNGTHTVALSNPPALTLFPQLSQQCPFTQRNALTSCHVSAASFNLEQFFSLSLLVMTLMEKNTGQLLPRMSLVAFV